MPQRRSAPTRRVATKQPTSLPARGPRGLADAPSLSLRRGGVAAHWPPWAAGRWAAGRSSDDDAETLKKVPESAVSAQSRLERDGKLRGRRHAGRLGEAALRHARLVQRRRRRRLLLPTETAKPLAEGGAARPVSAECTTILEHAVGEAEASRFTMCAPAPPASSGPRPTSWTAFGACTRHRFPAQRWASRSSRTRAT